MPFVYSPPFGRNGLERQTIIKLSFPDNCKPLSNNPTLYDLCVLCVKLRVLVCSEDGSIVVGLGLRENDSTVAYRFLETVAKLVASFSARAGRSRTVERNLSDSVFLQV